ncbi:MAG: hypothetical protein IT443_02635 [Phycisphaeraceae bacterium]|nr:hypothetical protein [Phycisphaeraceae bacterium]
MIYLKRFLEWAKANPITIGSVAVMLLVIPLWMLLVVMPAGSFRQSVAGDVSRQLGEISRYTDATMTIPPQTPDGQPQEVKGVVNEAAIAKRQWIFEQTSKQYQDTLATVVKLNENRHLPILPDLFPEPKTSDLPIRAREAYRQIFPQFLAEYAPDAKLPRLNAGTPPAREEIVDEMRKSEQEYLVDIGGKAISNLSPAEQKEFEKRQNQRLREFLTRRARGISIYAPAEVTPGSPFDMGTWAFEKTVPRMADIWQSQMSLWVQQDIIQAIADTNKVEDPSYDVTTNPVKRLLKIEVIPGYVGIDNGGGMNAAAGPQQVSAPVAGPSGGETASLEQLFQQSVGGVGAAALAEGGPAVKTQQTPEEETYPPVDLKPKDYGVAHTGHRSNDLYDVWHAWVRVIVDADRIPQFLDHLSRVNLMTVLRVDLFDVDEYAHLQEGYVYGPDDAVEIHVLVESIWLRAWTKDLMPKPVRGRIGALPAVAPAP